MSSTNDFSNQGKLSNLQLQLLQLYAENVSDEDLTAIQRMIAQYFAQKASSAAQEAWDDAGYSTEKILSENMRTPYKKRDK